MEIRATVDTPSQKSPRAMLHRRRERRGRTSLTQSVAMNRHPSSSCPLTTSSTMDPAGSVSSSRASTSSGVLNFRDQSMIPSPSSSWQSHGSPLTGVPTSASNGGGARRPMIGATAPPMQSEARPIPS